MGERAENYIRNSRRVMRIGTTEGKNPVIVRRMGERAGNYTQNPRRMVRMGTTGGQEPNNSNQNG